MNILIRTDSSLKIGTGHFMRCLTLADELKAKDCEIHFVCRALNGNINHLIEEQGYNLHLLSAPVREFVSQSDEVAHAHWLEVHWQQDQKETSRIAHSFCKQIDWLIVDSYALDHRWENALRSCIKKIMVIDDLADRKHDCNLLLDQNYFMLPGKRYHNLVPAICQMALGPQYSLLRKEFLLAKKFCQLRGPEFNRILIYFGGNDHDNLTGLVLKALTLAELNHIALDVVVSPYNPYIEKLKNLSKRRGQASVHVQPKAFVELLIRADLFIGAGGTTTWERICLHLPGIVITTALNQEAFTAELDRDGFLYWLGRKQDIKAQEISDVALKLVAKIKDNKSDELHSFLKKPPDIVDAMGALRVAEILVPTSVKDISLRLAELEDVDIYFSWVNEEYVRKFAFSSEHVSWETHQKWFENKINSSETFMWVLETKIGLPIGQIRFDVHDQTAEISYSLDPIGRGRGWGKILLAKGIESFRLIRPVCPVQAKVKPENIPSCQSFQRLGFKSKNRGGVIVFYQAV
jgi:UDP-2,4-diacetamido-2,4,6-trideoxy-beta-L-altropyranose hydrolase